MHDFQKMGPNAAPASLRRAREDRAGASGVGARNMDNGSDHLARRIRGDWSKLLNRAEWRRLPWDAGH